MGDKTSECKLSNGWSRSYRETKRGYRVTSQHPSLPWNFITHGFLDPSHLCWAVIPHMGGAKRMGGGKRTRERALPKIFGPLQKSFWSDLSWIFCTGKNRALTPEGGWKTYRTRGGPKPLFGRGVIREVFHPPLFSDCALFARICVFLRPTTFRTTAIGNFRHENENPSKIFDANIAAQWPESFHFSSFLFPTQRDATFWLPIESLSIVFWNFLTYNWNTVDTEIKVKLIPR